MQINATAICTRAILGHCDLFNLVKGYNLSYLCSEHYVMFWWVCDLIYGERIKEDNVKSRTLICAQIAVALICTSTSIFGSG